MPKSDMQAAILHYEFYIRQMQGRTFYCEDDEGVLRRWYPPRLFAQKLKDMGENLND
jgi:hypothetical protein